jgi:cation diffusion facilitator CzcD-associated flavoprotein CzcO
MPGTEAEVVVVGGGAAGLSVAAALSRRDVHALVLERDEFVGATWSRRYERLRLHTVRRYSGLAHYPIPRTYPRYLSKNDFAEYLRSYAERLRLDIRTGEAVRMVRPCDAGLGWTVETDNRSWNASVVVVATGSYGEPRRPSWAGAQAYGGCLLHSSDYESGARFRGAKALVVGIGNSGAEIATDLVEQGAAEVTIAVRTPPPIIPRDLFGVVPVQLLGLALTPVPTPRLLDRLGDAVRRVGVGDLREYGLGPAAWGPFTARRPAVIDVGFLHELKAKRIQVRPAVSGLTASGVTFVDGSAEDFDVVVAATGFTAGLERFLHVPGAVGEKGEPRARSGRTTPFPGLYFTGFEETVRGTLFEIRRESKRLARQIARYLRS